MIADIRTISSFHYVCYGFIALILTLASMAELKSAEIKQGIPESTVVITDFRSKTYNLYRNIDIKSPISPHDANIFRFANEEDPGYYYHPAFLVKSVDVDSLDINFLETLTKPYISEKYYDDKIFEFSKNYFLKQLNRKEFFFNIKSDGVNIRFSGWYGKFAHIIIFTDYDSKQGFLEKATLFFNLPQLAVENADYKEEILSGKRHDFFYEYKSDAVDFKLVGYPVLRYDDNDELIVVNMVLDLTIYAKGE